MRISDWSSDVCSSDLEQQHARRCQQCLGERSQLQDAERGYGGHHGHGDAVAGFCPGHRRQPGIGERDIDFAGRSEEHTSELQSLMRISYAVFCLKKKNNTILQNHYTNTLDSMN